MTVGKFTKARHFRLVVSAFYCGSSSYAECGCGRQKMKNSTFDFSGHHTPQISAADRKDTIFERFRCGLSSCEKMSSKLQIFFEIHPFTFWEKKFPKCGPPGHGAFKHYRFGNCKLFAIRALELERA